MVSLCTNQKNNYITNQFRMHIILILGYMGHANAMNEGFTLTGQ